MLGDDRVFDPWNGPAIGTANLVGPHWRYEMSLNANLLWSATALAACVVMTGSVSSPASARVVVAFGFGVPVVPAPWYYAPPPVVYAPPPVIYAPPPAPVAEQPAYVSEPDQNWY